MNQISQHLTQIRQRIAAACRRAGRQPEQVTILAATKTRSVREVRAAVEAGISHVGENYVQELLTKKEHLDQAGHTDVAWHVIGHLQRNKVKYVASFCHLIQSVDSIRIAREISKRARQADRTQPVLIEVNISGEDTKFGIRPEEVAQLAAQVVQLDNIQLQGLMTMPPYSDDPEDSRPHFQKLAALSQQLTDGGLPPATMRHLSMGMSGDYEVAVEEGAAIVRLGTVLFGRRED